MPKHEGESNQEFFRRTAREAARQAALAHDVHPPIRDRVQSALMHEGFLSEAEAGEAAFHMTDWLADLADLNDLLASEAWEPEHARGVLMGFLSHAPHHLAAAARIVMDSPVEDVFKLGAVKGSGRAVRKPGQPYADEPPRSTHPHA
jgi:hypothetical protein